MPVFEFEHTDGKTYEIEAPDEQAALSVWGKNKPSTETAADTALGYGKTIASAIPKIATNLVGGAAAGAATLGGLESPSAALGYKDPFKGKGPPKSLSDVWERMTTGGGQNIPEPPNSAWLTNKATEKLGLHTPQTPGEQIADVTTQGIGGAFLGGAPVGASIPATALLYGALPAAASEYVRQKTEGIKVPQSIPLIGGKDISPAASALTSMFAPVPVRKFVTPNTLNNPVRQQQYDTVVRESNGRFTPTAGTLFQDQAQINRELAARPDINRQHSGAIMETVTGHAGEPTTDITAGSRGDWVDRNLTRTGRNIDNLEQTTHIQHPTGNPTLRTGSSALAFPEFGNIAMRRPQDVPAILKTIEDTIGRVPSTSVLPGEEIHNALFNSIGTGRLTGEQYRRLATNLNSAAENAGSNELKHSFRQTANALHDAMSSTNPAWGQAWGQARREYANTLVGQKLASKGAGIGQTRFSPKEIATATKSVMGEVPFVRGELENAPFVSSAGAFPPLKAKPLPEKPSLPMRAAAYVPGARTAINHGGVIGAGLGALAGPHLGWPAEGTAILGAILGEGTKKALNMPPSPYLSAMNPVSQWYKKNQMAPLPSKGDRRSAAAIRALFNNAIQNKQ